MCGLLRAGEGVLRALFSGDAPTLCCDSCSGDNTAEATAIASCLPTSGISLATMSATVFAESAPALAATMASSAAAATACPRRSVSLRVEVLAVLLCGDWPADLLRERRLCLCSRLGLCLLLRVVRVTRPVTPAGVAWCRAVTCGVCRR